MAEALTGTIERITFHNLDSGYVVLKVLVKGHRELVAVVGNLCRLPSPASMSRPRANGSTTANTGCNSKHRLCGPRRRTRLRGLPNICGSGLIKGIGPAYCQTHRRDLRRTHAGRYRQDADESLGSQRHRPATAATHPQKLGRAARRPFRSGLPELVRHRHRPSHSNIQEPTAMRPSRRSKATPTAWRPTFGGSVSRSRTTWRCD